MSLKLPSGVPVSHEWFLFDVCPFCKKYRKFNWNLLTESGHCWSCKRGIWGYNKLHKVIDCVDIDSIPQGPTKVFKGLQGAHLINAWDNPKAQSFLMGRGLTEGVVREAQIMYNVNSPSLYLKVLPVIPDKPVGYIYRKLPKGFWSVASGLSGFYGWNQQICLTRRTVLICEGVFDLLSTGLYRDGVALLGSSPGQPWFRFFRENRNRLILWFDPDKAGLEATKKISELCIYYGIDFDVIYSKLNPKDYLSINPANKPFLDYVRKMINNESDFNYRRYTFKA